MNHATKDKVKTARQLWRLFALFGLSCSFVNTIVFACGHPMLQLCQFYAYCTVFESIKLMI